MTAVPARSAALRRLLAAALLLLFAALVALGSWQLERRAWKHALIARVEQRVHAPPADAPGPGRWPQVNAADDEYRHLRLQGSYLAGHDTRVQAVTERGSGFWLLSPLRLVDGTTVLVNRGFVPPGWHGAAGPQATTVVTGLLRLPEPGGAFLRRNDPAAGRWFSRDVAAIAAAQGLGAVAPYFVDADAGAAGTPDAAAPVGGLTVVRFHDNHLVYALTWYTLALMLAGAAWQLRREGRQAPAAPR